MKVAFALLLLLSSLEAYVRCRMNMSYDPLGEFINSQKEGKHVDYYSAFVEAEDSVVYIGPQDGLKEADKIGMLPGQPNGFNIDHYSGYVTVDPKAERALFYYFVESQNSLTKPLVLWLNGGPGCSSFGYGAMMELGPFRVNCDGTSLSHNEYAWSNLANMLFLESPAGVGFSYSNTSSDYDLIGDKRAAEDSFTFLVNWFERFPEYKTREFFITGESYAGHYIPQLALKILQYNISNQTFVNLKGIAMGNAWIDFETGNKGMFDFLWTHDLISDEIHSLINFNCNFTSPASISEACMYSINRAYQSMGNMDIYDIYEHLLERYVQSYLNNPLVQKSFHANVTRIRGPWKSCNISVNRYWKDSHLTVLPIIQELTTSGISVYFYSGDTDGRVPTTSTRYSINKLGASVETPWYPWYIQGEVGGYVMGYQNLTFVTIRGAGNMVPSSQPARAFAFLSCFLNGKLPPPANR